MGFLRATLFSAERSDSLWNEFVFIPMDLAGANSLLLCLGVLILPFLFFVSVISSAQSFLLCQYFTLKRTSGRRYQAQFSL